MELLRSYQGIDLGLSGVPESVFGIGRSSPADPVRPDCGPARRASRIIFACNRSPAEALVGGIVLVDAEAAAPDDDWLELAAVAAYARFHSIRSMRGDGDRIDGSDQMVLEGGREKFLRRTPSRRPSRRCR